MTTLVVQAHPIEQSYSGALLDAVTERLPDARVVRLGQGDRWTTYSCIDITRLIVVYPTWWGSLPAMLLAALNEIVGPWVDGNESITTSPLRTVEAITVVTTHGSPKRINMLQGEPGLQLWKRTILPLCAPGATFEWTSLYKLDQATVAERTGFLADVADSVSATLA